MIFLSKFVSAPHHKFMIPLSMDKPFQLVVGLLAFEGLPGKKQSFVIFLLVNFFLFSVMLLYQAKLTKHFKYHKAKALILMRHIKCCKLGLAEERM